VGTEGLLPCSQEAALKPVKHFVTSCENSRRLRKLHNEEFHNLHSSANIVSVIKWSMRWTEHVAHMEGKCSILVGNPEEKSPFVALYLKWTTK